MTEESVVRDEPGLGRRAVIKRAAAAGAVAWTAPIIIDSLASPAAAATVAAGCYQVYFPSANTCAQSLTTPTGACLPTGWPKTNLQTGLVSSANCANATSPVAFTIAGDVSCYFASGQAQKSGPATCIAGVITNGGKTITFTKPNGSWQDGGFRMTVTCGGVAC